MKQITRREMLENCIVRGLLVAGVPMAAPGLLEAWQQAVAVSGKPTSSEVLGPFYRKGAPNTAQLRQPGDPGLPLRITGNVTSTRGEKLPGAQVDIWQTDHSGHYDPRGYRYRAKLLVAEASEYSVETVMPGHYPDRPVQHIHYMIAAPGHKTVITQLYFATDPWFEGDIKKKVANSGLVDNLELVRPVTLYEEGDSARAAVTFDICLDKA